MVYLEIRPGAVDVNVHPAKTEVKFSEERRVFNLLYQAALETLHGEDRVAPEKAQAVTAADVTNGLSENKTVKPETAAPVKTERPYETAAMPAWKQTAEPALTAGPVPAQVPADRKQRDNGQSAGNTRASAVNKTERPAERPTVQQTLFSAAVTSDTTAPRTVSAPIQEEKTVDSETPVENPVQDVDNFSVPDHKIVGEALKTYIIVEVEDRIILIDKHAAHERMNFDRLKAQQREIPAQQLLAPITRRVTAEEMGLLEEFGELFEEFGFEIEPFGEHEVILRAVPADILLDDALPALEEILEHLEEGNAPDPRSARDELLHTVACKAAIKAGWNTGMAELERIAAEVLSGRVKYCPHGRPVSATVTRKELDKLFLRIV